MILSGCNEGSDEASADTGNEETEQETNEDTKKEETEKESEKDAEKKTVELGETFKVDGVEITVTNPVWTTNTEYPDPENDGYFVVKATAENKSEEPVNGLDFIFSLKTPENEIYEESYVEQIGTQFTNLSDLAPKAKRTGQIAFDVPKTDEYTLIVDPKITPEQVEINITEDKIMKNQ